MRTYNRKCIKDFSFEIEGEKYEIKKDKKYITSDVSDNNTLIVFDHRGWFTDISKDIFDEGVLFSK